MIYYYGFSAVDQTTQKKATVKSTVAVVKAEYNKPIIADKTSITPSTKDGKCYHN